MRGLVNFFRLLSGFLKNQDFLLGSGFLFWMLDFWGGLVDVIIIVFGGSKNAAPTRPFF